jgi:TonB family protein
MRRALAACLALTLCASAAWSQEGARRDRPPAKAPRQPVVTRPPELLEAPAPTVPPEAVGLEADVKIRLSVDATGTVTRVDVVEPAGHGLDEAAVEAARAYRFRPAELDGKPGPITIETVIHFRPAVVETPPTEPPTEEPPPAVPSTPPQASAVLTGLVKERGTRRALAGVSIALTELTGAEAETDAGGRFRLEHLAAGTYHVVALRAGYDRLVEPVTLAAGEASEVAVFLRPSGGNPYETVVEGERERLEVTRRTLTRRELTTVPGTFGDPLRVIQNLPGLARAPFASGLLLIRGSNPNDSGVFVDGHSVPLLYHFLGGPSILNPEFLESVDLYPGGFPARFGRFHGGVVEVNTRPSASDGVHGEAKVDLIDSSVYLRFPVADHVTLALAGRRSYIDAILPLVLPKQDPGNSLVVTPVYWDYQLRLDLELPARQRLSLLLFGSDDQLHVLQAKAEDAKTLQLDSHIGFHRARLLYTTPLVGDLVLSLSPDFGLDTLSLTTSSINSTELHNTVLSLRERVTGKLSPSLRLDTGFDLDDRVTRYDLNIPQAQDIRTPIAAIDLPTESLSRTVDQYGLGAYLELAWDLGPIRLVPGLRFDGYLLAGKPRASLDPRLVARWQAAEQTVLKAYVGLFHEPPSPETLDTVFGNPDLDLERAVHVGAGVEQKLTKDLEVDAEIYTIQRDDLAAFSLDVVARPDGSLRRLNFANTGHGSTYGLELYLKHQVTERFYGWLAYTLSRSVIQNRPDEAEAPSPFDQTHNLIAVASYRLGSGWEAGVRYRFSTGRPQTPVIGATYNADTDTFLALLGPLRSGRRANFNELDVRVDKTWLFDNWSLDVYLDVINVFNAENAEATQYDYRFRDTAPVRGVPIVPTLGVKGQW